MTLAGTPLRWTFVSEQDQLLAFVELGHHFVSPKATQLLQQLIFVLVGVRAKLLTFQVALFTVAVISGGYGASKAGDKQLLSQLVGILVQVDCSFVIVMLIMIVQESRVSASWHVDQLGFFVVFEQLVERLHGLVMILVRLLVHLRILTPNHVMLVTLATCEQHIVVSSLQAIHFVGNQIVQKVPRSLRIAQEQDVKFLHVRS